MAITPGEIGEAVAKALPGFFNDAIDQLRQGEGAYLRDGEPVGIVGQVGQAVGRSACRQYAAQGPDAVGSKGERFERACRPYLDSLNPGDGIDFVTPFLGGQCSGQLYVGSYEYQIGPEASPTTGTAFFKAYGPVAGPRVGSNTSGQDGVGLVSRGALQGQGTSFQCGVGINPTLGASRYQQFITGARSPVLVSISPCGLDNCGNPPPIVVPPTRRPDPNPPPFVFNPAPNIDIPIDVDINPDGTITFNPGDGPRTVDPFPEDEEPGGGGGGDPGDPTDPGSPGGGGDTGDGGSEDGAAGEGEELVGLLVEVLSSPENANRFDNNSAQPFRGIGYVRMGYPNRLGLDISGGTVISPQFFHAQQRGLTNWQVDANVGFNLRITPYYRELQE